MGMYLRKMSTCQGLDRREWWRHWQRNRGWGEGTAPCTIGEGGTIMATPPRTRIVHHPTALGALPPGRTPHHCGQCATPPGCASRDSRQPRPHLLSAPSAGTCSFATGWRSPPPSPVASREEGGSLDLQQGFEEDTVTAQRQINSRVIQC